MLFSVGPIGTSKRVYILLLHEPFCKLWLNPGAKNDSAYSRRNNWPLLDSKTSGMVRQLRCGQSPLIISDSNVLSCLEMSFPTMWLMTVKRKKNGVTFNSQNGWISTSLSPETGKNPWRIAQGTISSLSPSSWRSLSRVSCLSWGLVASGRWNDKFEDRMGCILTGSIITPRNHVTLTNERLEVGIKKKQVMNLTVVVPGILRGGPHDLILEQLPGWWLGLYGCHGKGRFLMMITPQETNECPLEINGWFRCISSWNSPFLGP